jgi:hypothetical protein
MTKITPTAHWCERATPVRFLAWSAVLPASEKGAIEHGAG